MIKLSVIIAVAFLLDFLFGDPYFIPHPIIFIGKLISTGEKLLRKLFSKTNRAEFFAGMLLTILVVTVSFIIPFVLLMLLYKLNFYLGAVVETFFCFQIFAAKSLKSESMKVYFPLKNGNLAEARKFLSYIVGRDTANLNETAITKATVETVAENTSDGVVAPLIFMVIGGAPLGFLYKAVNTLDSMTGYKNEKYLYFGRFAAKLDDAANFVPARISAILMIAAAFILRLDAKNAFKIFFRDRKKHASPNSAQTESVCAGALNIQLAGNAYYFGKLYEKPFIGDANQPVEAEDIAKANRLMYATSVLSVIIFCLIRVAVFIILGWL